MDDKEYIKKQIPKFIKWMNDKNGKTIPFNTRDISNTPAFFPELYENNNVLHCFTSYSEEIRIYSKICKNKIFPLTEYENLETNFFTDEYIKNLNADPETAYDNLDSAYEELIHDIGFTLLNFNSTAVIGLFHLFEKGCRSMIKTELESFWFNGYILVDDNKNESRISEIDKNFDRWDLWLKILLNIDIFQDFPNIKKLKLSANYLKHGKGNSKLRLEKAFPEIFNQDDSLLLCDVLSESSAKLIHLDFDELINECLLFWEKIKNYEKEKANKTILTF